MLKTINSNWLSSWDIPNHFANLVKSASKWTHDKIIVKQSNGYIDNIISGEYYQCVVLDTGVEKSGNYILEFDGIGIISLGGYSNRDKWANEMTSGVQEITLDGDDGGALCIWFKGTSIKTLSLRLVGNNGVWDNDYIEYIKGTNSDIFRSMNLQNTNHDKSDNFNQRTKISDITYFNGVPHEHLCELVDILQLDLFICIPTRYSFNDVKLLANLYTEYLPDNATLYVEYSNELWNNGSWYMDNNQYAALVSHKAQPFTLTQGVVTTNASHGLITGDMIHVFVDYKQSINLEGIDWRLTKGIPLVVTVTGINTLTFVDDITIYNSDITGFIKRELDTTKRLSNRITHSCNIINTFNEHHSCNRVYSTQNATAGLSEYEYYTTTNKKLIQFDTLCIAPYIKTSVLVAKLYYDGFNIKIDAYTNQHTTIHLVIRDSSHRVVVDVKQPSKPLSINTLFVTTVVNLEDIYFIDIQDSSTKIDAKFNLNSIGDFVISESFESRERRDIESVSEILIELPKHLSNANYLGANLATYEGGFDNYYPYAPVYVTDYINEYYRSDSVLRVLTKLTKLLELGGSKSFSFYKECSKSIFALTTNINNKLTDSRYRFWANF